MYSVSMGETPPNVSLVKTKAAGKFSQSESTEMLAFSMAKEWTSEDKLEYETQIEMTEATDGAKMEEAKSKTEMTNSSTAETEMTVMNTGNEMTKSSSAETEMTVMNTGNEMTKSSSAEIEMTVLKTGLEMSKSSTDETEMTVGTSDDVTEANIYDNVHLKKTNSENNTKNKLSEQTSYVSSVEETKEKSRVNYLAHLVVFAFFPCWLFVWCCLTLTNQDYEKFVKKTKKKGK